MRLPTLGAGYRHRVNKWCCAYSTATADLEPGNSGNGVVASTVGWGCGLQWVLALILMMLAGMPGSPLTGWKDDALVHALQGDGVR